MSVYMCPEKLSDSNNWSVKVGYTQKLPKDASLTYKRS